jgi:phosphoribosyl 1,2-cyclic phosphodiesterase
MRVTLYGTRGSTPVSDQRMQRYGGNTTCLRIESNCLPQGWALAVDTGSGFVPLSKNLCSEKIMQVGILYTHWHHDHTQGLFLAPHTFMPTAQMRVWGPKEHGVGPLEVFQQLMKPPLFPVDFQKVQHRIKTTPLEHVGTQVMVIHPHGGFMLMDIHRYRERIAEKKQISMGHGTRYSVDECLVIFMYKTEHPEYTVSYRFEEKPTGKTFVFLTDHENTASLPRDLRTHVHGANLLIQDGQYAQAVYETTTAGFGHGTPKYCAEVMVAAQVERLGITHHDPGATDEDVDARIGEAREAAKALGVTNVDDRIFGCADYAVIDV